jgi:glycosyltransferase involved in cell wall biosynthesis
MFNKRDVSRNKYGIPVGLPVGIFVGEFNDVKGWNQIRSVVESRPDVYFILVSKNPNDRYYSSNSVVYNKIDQDTLVELMSCSDFFILGSPVETQCLAALEACFCGLPVIMNNTGIFMDWEDRDRFGIFGQDFSSSINAVLKGSYNTREAILTKGLSIADMVRKWVDLLETI